VRRQGCFDPAAVSELVRRHHEGRVDHGRSIWSLLMFSMWSEQWRG
jgi:asparagine synthase (glutamine-hydrolysing)